MEPSAIFIGDSCHVFREKTYVAMQEMKCQCSDMLHPIALYDAVSSCAVSL